MNGRRTSERRTGERESWEPATRRDNAPATLAFSACAVALVLAACGGGGSGDASDPDAAAPTPTNRDAVIDPAPEFVEPGAYGCEGCPSGLFDDFDVATSESSMRFDGIVDDADGNGEFFVRSVDGRTLAGAIPTNANGSFEFTAPLFCGVQIVKSVWSNEAGRYVLVTEVTSEDCVDADIQLTLNWDELGRDYELHLLEPGGTINDNESDCTWTSCIGTGPDWGVEGDPGDDPRKDVDDTGAFGPENIRLAGPVAGTYHVLVEHWGSGDPASGGSVTFNVDGLTRVAKIANFPSRSVWDVGTIEWPSGEITLDGGVVDCSESWSSGCRLPLPDRTASP